MNTHRRKGFIRGLVAGAWVSGFTLAAAASTLTLVSPSGATATHNLAGTGARSFTLAEQGDWTVTLAMADGGTLTSTLTVNEAAFILVVR